MNVTYAVSGFGVLVLDGQVSDVGVAAAAKGVRQHKDLIAGQRSSNSAGVELAHQHVGGPSQRPQAEEIAPRTVAALDSAGRLVLVAIDGVEHLLLGLTLTETAEIFASKTDGFPLGGTVRVCTCVWVGMDVRACGATANYM